MLNPNQIRQDFPILDSLIHNHRLVYLDNAATSQKPMAVIEAMTNYYLKSNANVHRGVHTLSDRSTEIYQQSRQVIADFIHASKAEELILTRNTTEATNLIARSWGDANIDRDDEIIVTELEHHSNLLPWQQLAERKGARLILVPVDGNGDLSLDHLISLIGQKTKLVCLTQVSNVLGTVVDVGHIIKNVKRSNQSVKFLIDAAQSVPHQPVNVVDLKADFLVFSGHKMLGPQGIGVLYAKRDILSQMKPYLVGGGMISEVFEDHATWADLPDKFDAGTPNVAGAVGLAAACNYLDDVGMGNIHEHEQQLTAYGLQQLKLLETEGLVSIYGTRDPAKRAGILTFNIVGVHAHDTAQILDREYGIAVRSGHHCNQLLAKKLGVSATVRASFYLYNNQAEIDILIKGIRRVKEIIK